MSKKPNNYSLILVILFILIQFMGFNKNLLYSIDAQLKEKQLIEHTVENMREDFLKNFGPLGDFIDKNGIRNLYNEEHTSTKCFCIMQRLISYIKETIQKRHPSEISQLEILNFIYKKVNKKDETMLNLVVLMYYCLVDISQENKIISYGYYASSFKTIVFKDYFTEMPILFKKIVKKFYPKDYNIFFIENMTTEEIENLCEKHESNENQHIKDLKNNLKHCFPINAIENKEYLFSALYKLPLLILSREICEKALADHYFDSLIKEEDQIINPLIVQDLDLVKIIEKIKEDCLMNFCPRGNFIDKNNIANSYDETLTSTKFLNVMGNLILSIDKTIKKYSSEQISNLQILHFICKKINEKEEKMLQLITLEYYLEVKMTKEWQSPASSLVNTTKFVPFHHYFTIMPILLNKIMEEYFPSDYNIFFLQNMSGNEIEDLCQKHESGEDSEITQLKQSIVALLNKKDNKTTNIKEFKEKFLFDLYKKPISYVLETKLCQEFSNDYFDSLINKKDKTILDSSGNPIITTLPSETNNSNNRRKIITIFIITWIILGIIYVESRENKNVAQDNKQKNQRKSKYEWISDGKEGE